ncbi:oligosaccharide flippase family protein [Hymenobacter sp. BT491]|uniref:oligosaccharide flippase family protein n=1 Tax=Hymenobacter sp. BT491 TaxID=2766779 RepID=UPI001653479D|nr:oligosaccharide flippase family protein [Hymenobacter sp. BT491]MBC6988808.1 oligosaccharide flippase family protein [Hymenobacter sp. BT491]
MSDSSSIPASTLRGLRWSMIATGAIAVLQFVYSAVMSRLLTPADFGLMGMAMVVISFGSYFAQMGLEQALIQRQDLQPVHVRATFTVALVLGLAATGIVWLGAPLIKHLFSEPGVVEVLRAMSFTFLFTSLGATSLSLLRRRLAFDLLARIELGSFLFGYGVVGLGMAWAGYGIWSLVGATLTNQLLTAVVAWLYVRHSLSPPIRWEHYQPLLHFGGAVSAVSILEFVGSNLDRVGIGRLLGTWSLGLYNRTLMLVHLPLYHLSNSISRVLLPSYSSLQNDLPKLRQLYLTAITLSVWILLPLAAGISAAAEPIVRVALGPQWDAAIPLLGLLALVVGFNLLTMYSGALCEALAKLKFKVALQSCLIVVMGAGLWVSSHYGLTAMVLTILAVEVVRNLAYQLAIRRYLSISIAELWSCYWPALFTGLLVAIVLGSVRLGLAALHAGALLQLLILLPLGAVALFGQLLMPWNRFVRMRFYHEIREHLRPGPLRDRLINLLAPSPVGRRPKGWVAANVRSVLVKRFSRTLLGPVAGSLPASAARSLVEISGWDSLQPHVSAIEELEEPQVVYYDFPIYYPTYFRRHKAFGARFAYSLRDVCVSPYSGLTWIPAANVTLAESIGSVRRLAGWGNNTPELLLPLQPLAASGPVVVCPPSPFFHWLTEILPNTLEAKRRWPDAKLLLPPAAACPAYMGQALALAFGPDWEQQTVRADGAVRVPQLQLLPVESDAGFVHPSAIHELRQTFLSPLPEEDIPGRRHVYISRRLATARQLADEAQLEEALNDLGVEIVYNENLDFSEQVQCYAGAQTIIALHGAGLTHMVWANPGLDVLEIFPNGYFNDCYARLATALGHNYQYIAAGTSQQAVVGGALPLKEIIGRVEQLIVSPSSSILQPA